MNSMVLRFLRVAWSVAPALLCLAWPAPGLAQGTVYFLNHIPGSLLTHIYLGGDRQLAGSGPNDYPAGTQDWTRFTPLLGTGYTAELWAADGLNQLESSLQPALPTTTFFTFGAGAGLLVGAEVGLPGVPFSDPATIIMRAWDNRGGTVTSWAAAQAVGAALGESPPFNIPSTGGPSTPAAPPLGLVSFNIYQVPEPSTLALPAFGATATWMFFRQRRSRL